MPSKSKKNIVNLAVYFACHVNTLLETLIQRIHASHRRSNANGICQNIQATVLWASNMTGAVLYNGSFSSKQCSIVCELYRANRLHTRLFSATFAHKIRLMLRHRFFFHICMRITQIDFKLNETILKIDCSFAYRTVCLQWKHESIFGMDTWFIAIISQLSENVPFSSNFVCCMVECSTFLLKKQFFFMNHSYVKKTASYTNHSIQRIIHPFQTQITF